MGKTTIEWCDVTWNPVRGCSLVSAGCSQCYAMKQAHRFSGKGGAYEGLTKMTSHGPTWTGRARVVPELLEAPLHWRKPQRIFVNSMSDLFHEDVPDEFIGDVFQTMACAPQHTFQILTKRPERMQRLFTNDVWIDDAYAGVFPLPNVWLGVSVEDQETADQRIPLLLKTPAAVRFISAEPLLEAIDLTKIVVPDDHAGKYAGHGYTFNALIREDDLTMFNAPAHIDWVIAGFESGPKARPGNINWLRSLRYQCRDAEVAFFCKQLGAAPVMDEREWGEWPSMPLPLLSARNLDKAPLGTVPLAFRDRSGGDMAEWPSDLRVRQFPEARQPECAVA